MNTQTARTTGQTGHTLDTITPVLIYSYTGLTVLLSHHTISLSCQSHYPPTTHSSELTCTFPSLFTLLCSSPRIVYPQDTKLSVHFDKGGSFNLMIVTLLITSEPQLPELSWVYFLLKSSHFWPLLFMGFYLNKQFMITPPSFPFSLPPQLHGYLLNKG